MTSSASIDTLWPGRPYPRGTTWDGMGVNFALFSESAERVELCLFDRSGRHEVKRIPLRERTDEVWHGYLPQARPGQLYAYRVYGPYKPSEGQRFNGNKLLLDPYARSIVGAVRWHDAVFGYRIGHADADLSFDRRDSAPYMPRCQVVESAFTWGNDRSPDIPWNDMVIYEMHVRGFTQRHPGVPPELRGTYAGLACAPVVEYLKRLGVSTVELMPVHAFVDDRYLVERGLRNYWGYNTIGYFAPEHRYSATGKVNEFKTMVRTLHAAGIEVLLDVVYNHTAEGSQLGPTLSFRGIDNAAYYRLSPDNARYYQDFTGCGNTLDMQHPRVLQLLTDSLRYWVTEMHVDGFRFDLASALARELHAVDRLSAFFDVLRQDPVLSRVKLIAEPWDLGSGGYQVGNFPVGWAEWNDKYRDTMRAYWKGAGGVIGEFAKRLTGSSDLYNRSGRRPYASINFVAAHDGFTLADLVTYNDKHNQANGEEGRDGHGHNLSWNCGVEGPSDDAAVLGLRARQQRNFIATLLLSQGVPMLLAGDEFGRSQGGNNNAYCQDNTTNWVDWNIDAPGRALIEFTRRMIALRAAHPSFRRTGFFDGRPLAREGSTSPARRGGTSHAERGAAAGGASPDTRMRDIVWLQPDGAEMGDEEWNQGFARALGVFLAGDGLNTTDAQGRALQDDSFLLLFNASELDLDFSLPAHLRLGPGEVHIDTSRPEQPAGVFVDPGTPYRVPARALALLGFRRGGLAA